MTYNPSLDGIRALAVLAVFGYHVDVIPAGYFGVDVFFVLSGFLITVLLLAEREEQGSISLSAFYWRRAYRLLPAFFAYLAAGAVLVLVLKGPEERVRFSAHAISALLYTNNWERAFRPADDGGSWLGHVWSLSIEEQFYLVWPACLVLLCKSSALRARLPALLLAGALGIVAWRLWLVASGAHDARTYFGTDTRADALLLGCALGAWRRDGYASWVPRWRKVIGPASAACLAAFCALAGEGIPWLRTGEYTLVALLSAGLVFSVDGPSSQWGRLLSGRQLVALGRVSYGFYLWHFPVTALVAGRMPKLLGVVVAGLASYALAALSHRLVEMPVQQRRRQARALVSS